MPHGLTAPARTILLQGAHHLAGHVILAETDQHLIADDLIQNLNPAACNSAANRRAKPQVRSISSISPVRPSDFSAAQTSMPRALRDNSAE